ncbi:flagellar biosynthetic protein FliR [Eoetvoesiella caeni]|uniref:Flagellar biosynthetic protein FliR n=1 Tax=Eoetvoesiella caeni TaxID=645616 RepID=A0A366HM51_9BURK|nr:flagellar biosynthetic protein FliR [Eoetvoesiella caeni]MCI2807296.1 flagellar biosynthetic protein FliR [Eoetvoesiella caeni]NYT53309.1 flagellar biosynthetic protein FliR [Eoetvoesiella caeni]RBP43291.1 flagellar biosynthetic protein FliR [Eoetvoesiella caeni]
MVSFELDQLYGWITAFLWPFFRILSLMGTAPVLGDASIPLRVKVGFAAMVTVAIAPSLGPMPAVAPASYEGLWITLQQVLIGIALGLTMRIVFAAVQTAGEFIGLQMGLSFASFFDPATGANTAVLARIMNVVATLLFLALNGHLLMLAGVLRTFEVLPISAHAMNTDGFSVLFEWSSQVMTSGMLLALPLIIVLLTINLALGILNRTAQQLSVFAVGFPISLTTGLILLMVVLPQTSPFLTRLFDSGYAAMSRLTQALAGG